VLRTIALTYRGLDQPIYFSMEGYLLDDQGKCPTVNPVTKP
jgi:hypothetical protein